MESGKFTYGDTVKVMKDAPQSFKPGELAEVCSMWIIETEENSLSRGEPLGSTIYSIEFGDGTIVEVPERYLKKP